jgi:hypothetical protein
MDCAEDGCDRPAAVHLYDPRGRDRDVCLPHARSLVQAAGVVASPVEDADVEWP